VVAMPVSRPFVDIHDVSLRFGGADGTLALDDLSMKIQPGEFIEVVGPSGCGKSTLMKLLSGLWPASDGTVIVDGAEVTGPVSIAGMAFQNRRCCPGAASSATCCCRWRSCGRTATGYGENARPTKHAPSSCWRWLAWRLFFPRHQSTRSTSAIKVAGLVRRAQSGTRPRFQ
jgi:ABC-type cobalamin/Fe3+-siderophores transport system ATPase subunit